jgi:predicted ATPase/class 3 adenylate cyclase
MKSVDAQLRLEGERRQVTALFYDVVGSTELMMGGDAEEYFRSVNSLHATAETIVASYGGFLHKRLGDGGCCFFGYPQQSEDAAEGAVAAGLELIRAASGRARKHRPSLDLRVGIATGVVMLPADSGEVIGTAPVLAARLQAEAEPNSVLVTEETFRLTSDAFVYHRLGEIRLKGFKKPSVLWRPDARVTAAEPSLLHPMRVMIGRDHELGLLTDAWERAKAGRGGAFALVGEAGIGKSRLVSAFLGRIDGRSIALQCGKRSEGEPLHPFTAFLRSLVSPLVLRQGDPNMLRSALQAAGIVAGSGTAEAIAAFTRERSGGLARNIRVADLSGRASRRQVIDAAVELLCSHDVTTARAIILEDVHWADEMTLELLDRLCSLAPTMPVLVIATSREDHVREELTRLPLGGLEPAAMRELVAAHWQGKPPSGLSEMIVEKSDGMPLYAEELVHFLHDSAALPKPGNGWSSHLFDGQVSSLNDLLASRLAGTGPARRVAQFASAIGKEFTSGFLRRLLDKGDCEELERHIEVLVAHGIVEPSPQNPEAYQFRHVLLQEAAYGSLLKSDRLKIHKRIAKLLVEGSVPPLSDAIAAWQCAEARMHREAVRFALAAAEACVIRSAMREASIALELCSSEIELMPVRHPDRRESLLTMLQLKGVVATALEGEGSSTARRLYARAMKLVRHRPSTARAEHFPAYWGWWFTAPDIRSQQARAHVLVEDMMAVEDAETRLQAFHCAWATSFHAGEHGFCQDCVERGLKLYDQDRALRNRAFFGGHDARVCGLGESALSNLLLDQVDASERAIQSSLAHAEVIDHVGSMVHALYYALVLRHCQGRVADVHALGERMLTLAEQNGLLASQARALMYCGWAEVMEAPSEAAARRFEEGLAMHVRSGTDDNLSIHSDMHAQVLERTGRPLEARFVIDNAIRVGQKSGQLFWLAELYRRRARLRDELGERRARVRADLVSAVRTAEGQGARWLLERARRDLSDRG